MVWRRGWPLAPVRMGVSSAEEDAVAPHRRSFLHVGSRWRERTCNGHGLGRRRRSSNASVRARASGMSASEALANWPRPLPCSALIGAIAVRNGELRKPEANGPVEFLGTVARVPRTSAEPAGPRVRGRPRLCSAVADVPPSTSKVRRDDLPRWDRAPGRHRGRIRQWETGRLRKVFNERRRTELSRVIGRVEGNVIVSRCSTEGKRPIFESGPFGLGSTIDGLVEKGRRAGTGHW